MTKTSSSYAKPVNKKKLQKTKPISEPRADPKAEPKFGLGKGGAEVGVHVGSLCKQLRQAELRLTVNFTNWSSEAFGRTEIQS